MKNQLRIVFRDGVDYQLKVGGEFMVFRHNTIGEQDKLPMLKSLPFQSFLRTDE